MPAKLSSCLSMTAGGHQGLLLRAPEDLFPGCVLKKYSEVEHAALMAMQQTALRDFVPECKGTHEVDGALYLVMSNLLEGIVDPVVMDVKMGTRWLSRGLMMRRSSD